MIARCALALLALAACDAARAKTAPVVDREARIPRAPGEYAPSLVTVEPGPASEITTGAMLSDADSCASCHPDAAAQWNASAHSFASFGNPIYRDSVERVRDALGKPASRHCGGCHDMPLLADGLMTADAPIPADDVRAHSGVTCRLCHGVQSTTKDGNASYVWNATPLDAPVLGDAASIARHKQQVTTKLDSELCVSCHRGFLSPDLGLPVHLSGIDEPGWWRNSAYTGNGMARVDKVEQRTCIDCHMDREPASHDELGAKSGTLASHRFVGGHTWMAAMRGDTEQLRRTQAKLTGAASIDIAGARISGTWYLPADNAPIMPGTTLELDVVIRNLLVGHRFPGGVLDAQDTWVEVEVADRRGTRIASSGLAHESDPNDRDAHILRTLVVDEHGEILDEHEIAKFRAQVATQTLAPREAQAARYAFAIPRELQPGQLPLTITARLRHRSRTLALHAATCNAARTEQGRAFLSGARGARDVHLDPCKPQPITLVAETQLELGDGARKRSTRPDWERVYEHGMALVANIVTRSDEARAVLDVAARLAPDPRAQAMVAAQRGWVAAKQGRVTDALELVHQARELLHANPPVLDAIVADAYVRQNRWHEAVGPAKSCTERAPANAAAWAVYARVLAAVDDFSDALDAANHGLELAPRDPDLLRTQAVALAALGDPKAEAAHHAYVRFRSPDEAATLRIRCAKKSQACARDRNPTHTLPLAGTTSTHAIAR